MADQIIDIPGVGQVSFPAGMSDFDITKAIRTQIMPKYETKSQGMREGFGNAVLQNFGDEVKAGVRATVGPAIKKGMEFVGGLDKRLGLDGIGGGQEDFQKSPVGQTSDAATVGERHDEELTKQRTKDKKFAAENPALATATDVAGNIAGTSPLLAAGPAWLTSMGPSLALNALKMGAIGAGQGAIAGYGAGEGEGRPASAAMGAVFGGATGAAIPVVGSVLRQGFERVAPATLNAIGNVAERFVPRSKGGNSLSAAAPDGGAGIPIDSFPTKIADAARNKALSIEDEAAIRRLSIPLSGRFGPDSAQRQLNALGDGAFIGDANKGTERLAYATQANSDDAAESMLKAYTARNKATGTRFKAEVPGAPDARAADDFLNAYTSAEGSKIYDPVLRKGKLNVSDDMLRLMREKESLRDAMKLVEDANTGETLRLTQAEKVHLIKRALNRMEEGVTPDGKPVDKTVLRAAARQWEQALWDANPAIKDADTAYAKVASLPETFERGRNFAAQGRNENALNASPEALKADLPNMTPDQRNVLAAGTRSDIHRIASQGPDQTRRLAKSLTDGDDMVARLNEILGPEVTSNIISRANAERTFAEKFSNVMRGSQTAERNATLMRDQGISPPATGDIMSVIRWVRDSADKLNTPSEAVRRKLGDLLTNPNAAENAETLQLVRDLLSRRAPANALRSAIPGATGSQATGP